MFEHGMTEARTDRVQIDDTGNYLAHYIDFKLVCLDPEVLKEMLRFMYTGLVTFISSPKLIVDI